MALRPAIALLLLASQAGADMLSCSFTQVCAPQTGCQIRDQGVPFEFTRVDDTLALETATGPVTGTALPHIAPPNLTLLFELSPTGSAFLTLSQGAEAVWTEHSIDRTGAIRSISFFGTCRPEV